MQAPAVRIRRRCDTSTKFDYNRSHLTPSPALPLLRERGRSQLGVQGGQARLEGQSHPEVVLQIAPGGKILADAHTHLLEVARGPDARQQQQVRRTVRPCREHDLAVRAVVGRRSAVHDTHACGPVTVEEQLGYLSLDRSAASLSTSRSTQNTSVAGLR